MNGFLLKAGPRTQWATFSSCTFRLRYVVIVNTCVGTTHLESNLLALSLCMPTLDFSTSTLSAKLGIADGAQTRIGQIESLGS